MDREFRRGQADLYTEEQIANVLEHSGISIENDVDSNFIIFCPYHSNYRTPAGEVSKESGVFYCFGCHESRTLIDLVIFVTKKSYFEAMRLIDSCAKDLTDIVGIVDNALQEKETFVPFDPDLIKSLNKNALGSPRALDYFHGRNISTESVEKFELGYSVRQDMITIPVHDATGSMYLGFVARSIEGKRFINTDNLPKSKVWFNNHRARLNNEVFVLESALDVIRLDQHGVPAIAGLGSGTSKIQLKNLTNTYNSAIIIPDNDDAGYRMAEKIVKAMGSRATVVTLPKQFNDVGNLTEDDIEKILKKLQNPVFAIT